MNKPSLLACFVVAGSIAALATTTSAAEPLTQGECNYLFHDTQQVIGRLTMIFVSKRWEPDAATEAEHNFERLCPNYEKTKCETQMDAC